MIAYVSVLVIVCAGQALCVSRRRWGWITAIGLITAWLAGGALITILDPLLHAPEPLIVPLAHGACGLVLGAAQTRSLTTGRLRWALASAASWLIGAAVVFPLWNVTWLPGHVRGLFPGSAEMTTLLRLLPLYAIAMTLGERRTAVS